MVLQDAHALAEELRRRNPQTFQTLLCAKIASGSSRTWLGLASAEAPMSFICASSSDPTEVDKAKEAQKKKNELVRVPGTFVKQRAVSDKEQVWPLKYP